MIISNILIFVIAIAAGAEPPPGRLFIFNYAGITIEFPQDWQLDYTDEEPDILYANSPGEKMIVMVAVQPFENMDTLYSNLQYEFLQDYSAFKPMKKESKKINGLAALVGWSKLTFEDGYSDILTFAIVRIPGNKVLVLTTLNDQEASHEYAAEIKKIIYSIKPL